jgi:hypothetical protein
MTSHKSGRCQAAFVFELAGKHGTNISWRAQLENRDDDVAPRFRDDWEVVESGCSLDFNRLMLDSIVILLLVNPFSSVLPVHVLMGTANLLAPRPAPCRAPSPNYYFPCLTPSLPLSCPTTAPHQTSYPTFGKLVSTPHTCHGSFGASIGGSSYHDSDAKVHQKNWY